LQHEPSAVEAADACTKLLLFVFIIGQAGWQWSRLFPMQVETADNAGEINARSTMSATGLTMRVNDLLHV
jgi:hypothetical protein